MHWQNIFIALRFSKTCFCKTWEEKFDFPTPGIEPGPPGWEPGILTTRQCRMACWSEDSKVPFSLTHISAIVVKIIQNAKKKVGNVAWNLMSVTAQSTKIIVVHLKLSLTQIGSPCRGPLCSVGKASMCLALSSAPEMNSVTSAAGLVTNSILLCWLFKINDRCKNCSFY